MTDNPPDKAADLEEKPDELENEILTNDDVLDEAEGDETVRPIQYEISSYGADIDAEGFVKRLQRKDVFIPPFQRAYVWTQKEASRFIESLLLGLPVPGVFLAKQTDSNRLLVIDGQQRLKTLQFFLEGFGFDSYAEGFRQVRRNGAYCADLLEIVAHARCYATTPTPLDLPFPCPLTLHGHYGMREVSAAFGKATLETSGPTGTGVIHVPEKKLYLHFVTFEKSEKLFSESTMYRDYPISPTRLHWESQSTTAQETPTGQNYLRHAERGYTILFFARVRKTKGKLTSPFTFLGDARFIHATGNRPIAIEWELSHPLPAGFHHEARLASGL